MGKLTLREIETHPAFTHLIPDLKPATEDDLVVAKTRDGACSIRYEIHGTGPKKLVLIQGLNGIAISWWRQTKYFGHDKGEEYSVMVFDNRGVGHSHKPIRRYSTFHMAHDLLEVLDHVGWKDEKQLHLVGVSMGGMIAQELSLLIPQRVASLTLQSTAAKLDTFSQSPLRRLSLLIPKTEQRRLEAVQANIFAKSWLEAPDDRGEYPTNSDRFIAEEIWRKKNRPAAVFLGYLMQAFAATMHEVKPDRMKKIAEGVPRILVLHGDLDEMISVKHAHEILEGLGGESEKVKYKEFKGAAHQVQWERLEEFNKILEDWTKKVFDGKPVGGEA